jgi:prevent-host-death family protein
MAKIVPVREFRTRLSELLDDVADRRDHGLVTRNGRPAAAVVPIDEYEALARHARQQLLDLDRPLIDAVEEALGLLERDPHIGHELRGRICRTGACCQLHIDVPR